MVELFFDGARVAIASFSVDDREREHNVACGGVKCGVECEFFLPSPTMHHGRCNHCFKNADSQKHRVVYTRSCNYATKFLLSTACSDSL